RRARGPRPWRRRDGHRAPGRGHGTRRDARFGRRLAGRPHAPHDGGALPRRRRPRRRVAGEGDGRGDARAVRQHAAPEESLMRALAPLVVVRLAAVAFARGIDGRHLRVDGGRLVDRLGREITLRGVNARVDGLFDVTFDDGRLPLEPIPTFDDGDAARMAALGFDFLRLPINWSALEPVRWQYAGAYLDRIGAVVRLCARHGILVLLDFHQDAFSKEIGQDGAPRWVLDLLLGAGNYPYLGGPLDDLDKRRLAP